MQKQNEAKTFAKIRTSCGFYFTLDLHDSLFFDSPKVSDSLLIHELPKWILRYAQYDGIVGFVIARALPEAIHESKIDCHDLPKGKSRNDGVWRFARIALDSQIAESRNDRVFVAIRFHKGKRIQIILIPSCSLK